VNGSGRWYIISDNDLSFGEYEVKVKNGPQGEYSPSSHFNIFGSYIEDFQKYTTGSFNEFKTDYFLIEALISGSQYRPKVYDGMFTIIHGTYNKPANTGARVTFDEPLYKLKFDVSAYEQRGTSTLSLTLHFDDGSTRQLTLTNNTTDLVRNGSTAWGTFTYDSGSKSIVSADFTLTGNPGAYTQAWYLDNFIMGTTASIKTDSHIDNPSTTIGNEDEFMLTAIAENDEHNIIYEAHINQQNELIDLNHILANQDSISAINLEGSIQKTFTLSPQDIMTNAHDNLFIKSDAKQFMIKGDSSSLIHIGQLLGDENMVDSWTHAHGNLEIAGVRFDVYHNENIDTELLVQQGVKVDFS
jgi:hypothetical protein